jgi:hypothetical protein
MASRTRCWFVTLVLLVPAGASAQNYEYGGITGVNLDDCREAQELGLGYVRAGEPWWILQPDRNRPPDFAMQDRVFECFHNAGIRIFWSLTDAPDWAGGFTGGTHPHAGLPAPALYYRYVFDVLSHYAALPYDITFGIWNEPDGAHLQNCPPMVNKGACWGQNLWAPATAARAAVNPSARFAGPEMGTLDGRFTTALQWMSSSLAPQDVITVHWYGFAPGVYGWMDNAIALANGRETWLTETGYIAGCDEIAQATEVHSLMSHFRYRYQPAWTKVFYYQTARNTECASLTRPDGTSKPGFDVYRSFIASPAPPAPTYLTVSLQAGNGQYVVAENNGGDAVNANRNWSGPWETFTLRDANGGALQSGDVIQIGTSDGWWFRPGEPVRAIDGPAGSGLFQIVGIDSNAIGSGSRIALRALSLNKYLSAEGGGGDVVNANRTAIGAWEIFRIFIR